MPSKRRIDILTHIPPDQLGIIREAVPEARLHAIPTEGPLPELPAGTQPEVCLTFAWGSPNMDAVARSGVRWVHTIGTGVDRFPIEALDGQQLTCSRGASAPAISEWVLAVMLAFEKRLPQSWIREPVERWNMATLGTLEGRTLGLIGLGGIAQATARKAQAFGMHVQAFRRTAAPSPVEGVGVVGDLDALLASADHLVVAASATPATHHLLDAARIARLKPGVHLVNVARGSLIDQEALRAALDSGLVGMASLDVCTPEPLPAGHWLYDHPRVRLSPHISWSAPDAVPALFRVFRDNLLRWRDGLPLEGSVDLDQRY